MTQHTSPTADSLRRRYDLLRVTAADHVEFVCMYGYNTSLAEDVERYYRWLCFEYARQCGRIHRGLVDTLYRYNDRHMRGTFLQQLEEMGLFRLARGYGCREPAAGCL